MSQKIVIDAAGDFFTNGGEITRNTPLSGEVMKEIDKADKEMRRGGQLTGI